MPEPAGCIWCVLSAAAVFMPWWRRWRNFSPRLGGSSSVAGTLWSLWSRSRAPTPHGPGNRHAENAWMNITELNISSKSQTMSPNILLSVSIKIQLEVSTQNTCSRQTLSKSRRRCSRYRECTGSQVMICHPTFRNFWWWLIMGWILQLTVQIVQCNEGFLAVHNNPSGLFHDTPSFLLTDMKGKKNHDQSSKLLSIANELSIFRYT